MLVTRHPQHDPALRERLDPAYWDPAYATPLAACALPLAPLGDFITHLAYGPIVTGQAPPPRSEGIVVIHQGQVGATGVDPRGAVLIAAGGPWDRASARLQPEDLVLPRSGVASLAKNRVAVLLDDYPAVVGSFVDLVRLAGVDPIYVLVCLKTTVVWSQIHRLLNGVGTPNISFSEIRSLRVPLLAPDEQAACRRDYLARVHAAHRRWLGGDASAGESARRELAALIAHLNARCFPDGDSAVG